MRNKLAIAAMFAGVASPAFAHPDHGFGFPSLVHLLTEPDHLAIAAAVVILAVVGRFAFKRTRK